MRVVVRAGLSVLLDRLVPLAGAALPARRSCSGRRRAARGRRSPACSSSTGRVSRVAGRAAVVPAGRRSRRGRRGPPPTPAPRRSCSTAERSRRGAIGLDERIGVPVLVLPEATAAQLLSSPEALVAIAAPRTTRRAGRPGGAVLVLGLRVRRRDQARPARAGRRPRHRRARDGRTAAAFGTVNGSSAAAAVVAGAAALLAEARPEADADDAARAAGRRRDAARPAPLAAQGAGVLDLGRSAAAEIVADPPTLAFGRGTGEGWRGDAVVAPAQRLDAAR